MGEMKSMWAYIYVTYRWVNLVLLLKTPAGRSSISLLCKYLQKCYTVDPIAYSELGKNQFP